MLFATRWGGTSINKSEKKKIQGRKVKTFSFRKTSFVHSRSVTYHALILGYFGLKFLPDVRHCVRWVLVEIWAPDSSHKISNKFFIHHCQGWKEGSFVCETVWFFRGWILIRLTWNLSHFVPNPVDILTWIFRKKIYFGTIFQKFCANKGYLPLNLVKFRRHVHKEITKRRYSEEKPGRFVFGKPVLFTLGLGLTTPYSLGILVWNFYQTFVTVSVEFWLRFEPQIRPTNSH